MSDLTAALSRINSVMSYLPFVVGAVAAAVVTVINLRARARENRES